MLGWGMVVKRNIRMLVGIVYVVVSFYLINLVDRNRNADAWLFLSAKEMFYKVDKISMKSGTQFISIDTNSKEFDEVKRTLSPFAQHTGGITRVNARQMKNNSTVGLIQISYYIDGSELFAVNVYLSIQSPLTGLESISHIKRSNVFMYDDYYAVGFINNSTFLAGFDISLLEELTQIFDKLRN